MDSVDNIENKSIRQTTRSLATDEIFRGKKAQIANSCTNEFDLATICWRIGGIIHYCLE